ncbi:MAG: 50S ribosomal protein L18 [Candidatus Woesearchaeota archaeon]
MAKNCVFTVKYKRKRQGRTNYKKRLALLKSDKTRLVIRKTNTSILLQIVKYNPDGDYVISTFNSTKLNSYGWNYSKKSIPAAYLAGLSIGKMALAKKVDEVIVDLGLQTPCKGSKIFAAIQGAFDSGLKLNIDETIFINEERLSGKHIANMKDVDALFSKYKKDKLDVSKIPETFNAVKKKILGDN